MHAPEEGREKDRAGLPGLQLVLWRTTLQQITEAVPVAEILDHDQAGRAIAAVVARTERWVKTDLMCCMLGEPAQSLNRNQAGAGNCVVSGS